MQGWRNLFLYHILRRYIPFCFGTVIAVITLMAGSIMNPVAAQPLGQRTAMLWREYQHIPPDSLERAVDVLFSLSKCYWYLAQPATEDSVVDIMMERVRMSNDDALVMATMDRWFVGLDAFGLDPSPFTDTQRIAGYVRTMMNIARNGDNPEWQSEAWYGSARYAAAKGDYKTAEADMHRAWYEASLTDAELLKIRCLLLLSYCEERQLSKPEAFRHYADALYRSRQLNDAPYLIRCYQQLFVFYFVLGNYEKAEKYLYKTIPIILHDRPVDSVLLMNQLSSLVFLQGSFKEYDAALRTARCVLDYSLRNGNEYLRLPVLTSIKNILMEQGQYARLKDFYLRYYPRELAALAANEPEMYYQLKAAFGEADNRPDTALAYYRLSRREIFSSPHPANVKAFYLRRYGQFLLRFGKPAIAKPVLDSALRYAEEIQYLPYMAELSSQLDSISATAANMPEAYRYAKLNKRYSDALLSVNRQDEILMLDLENELRSRELLARQEETLTQRRHNIQYMAIVLLIGFCFLVLMLLGSFKVPHWGITAMGFFSFIFFFEFIVLIIDHKVHELTHGEPWKILIIKIVIIAGLLPLHHWLEHRVVHYLHTHKMIDPERIWLHPLIRKIRLAWKPVAKIVKGKTEAPPVKK